MQQDAERLAGRVAALEAALARETAAHRRTRQRLQEHRARLRELALQLCLAEERERRNIAADLHDHVGQALAMINIRVAEFRGNAVFCGFEESIEEVLRLLAQTIAYTRDLTGSISPPVLYELGLNDALDWLAERMQAKWGLRVAYREEGPAVDLGEELQVMLFRSVHELLLNVVKHAQTDRAELVLRRRPAGIELEVADEGRGFDPEQLDSRAGGFGLFSIRERMRHLGGEAVLRAAPGRGVRVTLSLPLAAEEESS